MQLLRSSLLLLGLAAATLPAATLQPHDIRTKTHAEIEAALPAEHPGAFYAYAIRLFAEGKKEDATFWYYVGQIRYRVFLKANPKLDPSGEPAVFSALNASVGRTINEWAGGDPKTMVKQIDRALIWDEAHPNGYTPRKGHEKDHAEIRAGLARLRETMEKNLPTLLEQRRKAGLEIRAE